MAEVFRKGRVLSLPPLRPYDLLYRGLLLSSRSCNLSQPEREAMEKYITGLPASFG